MSANEPVEQLSLDAYRELARRDPEAAMSAQRAGQVDDLLHGRVCPTCGTRREADG